MSTDGQRLLAGLATVMALLSGGARAQGEAGATDPAIVAAPALHGPEGASADGQFDLRWQVTLDGLEDPIATAVEFELEERAGDRRTLLPAGPHLAAALSGRDDGDYGYRVRAVRTGRPISPWSEPVMVQVRHHTLDFALRMFAIGAAVFLATVALVLIGHRRSLPADPGSPSGDATPS